MNGQGYYRSVVMDCGSVRNKMSAANVRFRRLNLVRAHKVQQMGVKPTLPRGKRTQLETRRVSDDRWRRPVTSELTWRPVDGEGACCSRQEMT